MVLHDHVIWVFTGRMMSLVKYKETNVRAHVNITLKQ